jgi:hypothetical protein
VAGGQGQEEEDKHEGDGSDVNNSAQWESLDALENSMDADATPLEPAAPLSSRETPSSRETRMGGSANSMDADAAPLDSP